MKWIIRRIRSTNIQKIKRIVRQVFPGSPTLQVITDDSDMLETADKIFFRKKKPGMIGLVQDRNSLPYWTKWKRYLDYNGINYSIYNVFRSDWFEEAQKFELILWRPLSSPVALDEARKKIYLLENELGKEVYPDFNTIMLYENKFLEYNLLKNRGFPVIETFVSFDYQESMEWVSAAQFPLISKQETSSGSSGTRLVRSLREAKKLVHEIFSASGCATYYPYYSQKNYVFFQPFVPNKGFDLRVIICGKKVFGYFRYCMPNDFRASGSKLVEKKEIPGEALTLASSIYDELNCVCLAIDMLYSTERNIFEIIEISPFIQVETDEQLKIAEDSGYYYRNEDAGFEFHTGRLWLQEVVLDYVLNNRRDIPVE